MPQCPDCDQRHPLTVWCDTCRRPTVVIAGEPFCLWCEVMGCPKTNPSDK